MSTYAELKPLQLAYYRRLLEAVRTAPSDLTPAQREALWTQLHGYTVPDDPLPPVCRLRFPTIESLLKADLRLRPLAACQACPQVKLCYSVASTIYEAIGSARAGDRTQIATAIAKLIAELEVLS